MNGSRVRRGSSCFFPTRIPGFFTVDNSLRNAQCWVRLQPYIYIVRSIDKLFQFSKVITFESQVNFITLIRSGVFSMSALNEENDKKLNIGIFKHYPFLLDHEIHFTNFSESKTDSSK